MAKTFDLSKLKPNEENPYPFKGSDSEWKSFLSKIERDPEFLKVRPIVYDSSKGNLIIGGNKRYLALVELGWKSIPNEYVADCKDWSPDKIRRFVFADNYNIGSWEMEFVDSEEAEEWGVEWDENIDNDPITDADNEVPELKSDTKVIRGDIIEFKKGNQYHRLMCGDSSVKGDLEILMNGQASDMVFADPPYGVGIGKKNAFLNSINGNKGNENDIIGDDLPPEELYHTLLLAFTNLREVSKESCAYYVTAPQNGGLGLMMMMMMMKDSGLEIRHVLNWVKNAPTFSMGRLDYDYKHEPILYTWTKKYNFYGKGQFQNSCWEIDKPRSSKEHPAMKPVELVENAILNSSKKGNIVVDIYGGSGTTMVAAHKTGRNAYLMEIMPNYCQVIIDRMLKIDNEIEIFVNGKEYATTLQQRR